MAGHVVCIGEVLVDFLGEGGQALEEAALFRPFPGGAPANAAVAAARAGVPAHLAGCVGMDAFGRLLRGTLEGAGVDCAQLRAHTALATTLAFVMPAVRGDFGFQFMRGADAALTPADCPPALLAGAAALLAGGVALSAEPARQATLFALAQARRAGALAVFDVNWRPRLWPSPDAGIAAAREAMAVTDVLKCNETELSLLAGTAGSLAERAAGLLSDGGPAAVVVTAGEAGALWVSAGTACHHAGFAVESVDAIGAGDCFAGQLLAWWARAGGGGRAAAAALGPAAATDLLARCNAAAALSTKRPGAMGAMPTDAAVDAFLRTAKARDASGPLGG